MRNIRTRPTENYVKIGDKRVDLFSAKIVYKCEQCHAQLSYKGAGLVCSANPSHKGFIHRNEVRAIREKQAQNVNQLSDFYQIVNGKVVLK